jgi:hypothetical protein
LILGEKPMVAYTTVHATLNPASNNSDVNQVKYLQIKLNLFTTATLVSMVTLAILLKNMSRNFKLIAA